MRKLIASLALIATALSASTALAQSAFVAPDSTFSGRISASPSEPASPILPGSTVTISGNGFKPGQEVVLHRGELVLNPDGAAIADNEGKFAFEITLPEDAAPGLHPVVVEADNPSSASIFDLKISPDVPLAGEDMFDAASQKLVPGLYQVAYSEASDALYVTSAVGRPPVKQSALLKVDPDTLEILAQIAPEAAPAREDGSDGGVFAVYGVDVDDAKGTVWVTNTRQNTVAVYEQGDLSLVKQFEPGIAQHARDVVVDAGNGKAYVGATTTPNIIVFDTETLEVVGTIELPTELRGQAASVGSLKFDPESGKLYTVSMSTNEAYVIDAAQQNIEKIIQLPGADGAIGVAHDPKTDRLFVASQGSDNILIVDVQSGEVLHDVAVGANPLNVAFNPEDDLAYVSNRVAGTLAVVNADGDIVANLENRPYPNHSTVGPSGVVYSVNKAAGEDNPESDQITRFSRK